jgi:hypothetical protein
MKWTPQNTITSASVLAALREITGREEVSLDDFGISDKPRSVLIHGPLQGGIDPRRQFTR